MKTTKTLMALLIGCGLAVAQVQAGPESRSGNDRVKSQIKNLDNDSFELRTKAMEDLRASGEDARADLEEAKKSSSLEVRTRAETLLKELDAKKTPATGVKKGVKPLVPDEDRPTETPAAGKAPPRVEDFRDVHAYIDAMQKWMRDQMGKDQRFPTFVIPDMDLKLDEKDQGLDIAGTHVITTDMLGGSSVSVTHKDGETVTWKSGSDGVTLTVQKRNEAGETTSESWSGKDEEDFKKQHPDVWEKYHSGEGMMRTFTVQGGRRGQNVFRGQRDQGGVAPVAPPPPITALREIDGAGPFLGVTTSEVSVVLDKQLKLKGEGVVVESVSEGSLAERMGIKPYDVLVQLDGQVIHDRDDIIRTVRKKDAPAQSTARVMREGTVTELSAAREKAK